MNQDQLGQKLDALTGDVREIMQDLKTVKRDAAETKEHAKATNGRVGALEIFRAKTEGENSSNSKFKENYLAPIVVGLIITAMMGYLGFSGKLGGKEVIREQVSKSPVGLTAPSTHGHHNVGHRNVRHAVAHVRPIANEPARTVRIPVPASLVEHHEQSLGTQHSTTHQTTAPVHHQASTPPTTPGSTPAAPASRATTTPPASTVEEAGKTVQETPTPIIPPVGQTVAQTVQGLTQTVEGVQPNVP